MRPCAFDRLAILSSLGALLQAVACGSVGDKFSDARPGSDDAGADGSAAGASGTGGSAAGTGGRPGGTGGAGNAAGGRAAGSGGSSGGGGGGSSSGGAATDGGTVTEGGAGDGATPCPDADRDGQTTCAGDCDDDDPLNFLGGSEICGDARDNDCNVQADEGCQSLGTFVAAWGNDSNPGTQALPVRTVGQGMANAIAIGAPRDVYVADGTYAENVALVEGISLRGGYACSGSPCPWTRDPSPCLTVLRPPSAEGLLAGSAITRRTAVEGFRIEGSSGGNGPRFGRAAVTLDGGSPTLARNCIYGPESSGGDFRLGRTDAITVLAPTADPAGALIVGNEIYGGRQTSGHGVSAVNFDWTSAGTTVAVVRNNVIVGGESAGSVSGVSHWSATTGTLIESNQISGGRSTGSGTAFATRGGGTIEIRGNYINAIPGRQTECAASGTSGSGLRNWCGGIDIESATAVIENNIIFGADASNSAGIRLGEFEQPAGLVVLNGNTVAAHPPGGASIDHASALVLTIGTCSGCGFRAEVGRIRNNILVAEHGANRFAVYEDAPNGKTQQPLAFENNLLHVPGLTGTDALYREWNGTTPTLLSTLGAVNGMVIPSGPVGSNLAADPLLDQTSHLLPRSPAIDAGTSADAPATDVDGDKRPNGAQVDIGADEAG